MGGRHLPQVTPASSMLSKAGSAQPEGGSPVFRCLRFLLPLDTWLSRLGLCPAFRGPHGLRASWETSAWESQALSGSSGPGDHCWDSGFQAASVYSPVRSAKSQAIWVAMWTFPTVGLGPGSLLLGQSPC